jgi:hypothetical protein
VRLFDRPIEQDWQNRDWQCVAASRRFPIIISDAELFHERVQTHSDVVFVQESQKLGLGSFASTFLAVSAAAQKLIPHRTANAFAAEVPASFFSDLWLLMHICFDWFAVGTANIADGRCQKHGQFSAVP